LGLARGVLSNRRRGDVRHAALVARLMTERLTDADQPSGEIDAALVSALGSLSVLDQELLLLVAWDGLSREQVAAVLGVARGTVAVRLHRARRRFERALAAQEAGMRSADGRSPEMEVF
jgi:RNA polymerase sigma factor (sigma-70 family)